MNLCRAQVWLCQPDVDPPEHNGAISEWYGHQVGVLGHEGEIQCCLEVIELALHAPQLRADVGRYLVAKVPNAHRVAAQYAKHRAKDKR